jgi:expansin (peptidoglycan-binding protein)
MYLENIIPIRFFAITFLCSFLQLGNVNAQCPAVPVIHTGEATFYTFASGAGACMFDSTPNDLMVGAMNAIDYGNSVVCGECVSLTGPNATIVIRIVDGCPGCSQGGIDLSPLAFSIIADTALGRVPITWHVVPCGVTGLIQYHFKDGSNQWWTAVQIRNHRNPILSLEYLNQQHTYTLVNRVMYNYFVEPTGMGPGPYSFRVTDVYGHVLYDDGIPHMENSSVAGHAQFPSCDDSLSIQLASFTATVLNQQTVRLDWTTLTETNNYGFEIQKTDTSQQNYQTIPNSFIAGHGTTSETHYYSYTDSTATSGVWYYRLKQIDLDDSVHYSNGIRVGILTGVNEKEIPAVFSLSQSYPNPFNPSTTINYQLPRQSHVMLKVFDVLGREVAMLVDRIEGPGYKTVNFDVSYACGGLSSGIYYYRLQAGDYIETRKLLLLK